VEPPEWEKWARKDVYRIGPQPDSGVMVEIALRFREFAGTYMEHCHNTQHEDHAMLLRWDIEHPGQVKLMPTPMPSWDRVTYVDSVALPTVRVGDGVGEFGPNLDDQAVSIWLAGMEVEQMDMVNMEIGDAVNPTEDERAVGKIPLRRGINIDSEGYEREVFFVLHDVSDEELAEELGIAWAGGLNGTPEAATAEAAFEYNDEDNKKKKKNKKNKKNKKKKNDDNGDGDDDGNWTFFGDLPNPIYFGPGHSALNDDRPAQSADNTYTPLRSVNIGGKDVLVNAFFISWGDEDWEHLRVDENCVVPDDFPDDPPNTSCRYNGDHWGLDTGHALEINTTAAEPFVRMKLHKSWTNGGDYLPYYLVVDAFPAGPANNMGVIYVPKHEFLAGSAVPLVQFAPPTPLTGGYPPTDANPFNNAGGGPLGGQIGLPSYFMPEDDYSPFWHIGFTNWLVDPAGEVIKGLDRLKELRAEGKVEIHEFPAITPDGVIDDYNFESLNSPHVVNCPTPVTIDFEIHRANKLVKAAQED
jgi:hypothetical protein